MGRLDGRAERADGRRVRAPLRKGRPSMSGAAEALSRLRTGEIFYGWYIVAAGALSSAVVLGVTTYGIGTFYEPMRRELGWSMAVLAAGVSVRTFETGFLSPFTGFLVDRLGPRNMAITGTLILCAGLVLLAQVHDVWLYYAASLLIALGQSLGAFTAFSAAIMRWFQKKRGRALGFMTFGNGMGYLSVPVLSLGIVCCAPAPNPTAICLTASGRMLPSLARLALSQSGPAPKAA
ncbi:MAG: MFS transporter [Chloroflexi bacterium]|nr:MFS transporter [Chloroflexota bacterium]